MRPSNMENANSPEYLEKIKNAVIENLKKTIPVPSVQMQDVPRQGFGTMTDEDDAALDDEDEDNNKDVRLTQRGFDKRVVADNEFEESDDEEMAEANGVYQTNGKRKGIQDYKNPFSQDDYDPVTNRDGAKQPTPEPEAQEKTGIDEGDETMEDVDAEVREEPVVEKETEAELAPQDADTDASAKVDKDGDVDMAEAAEAAEAAEEAVPSIKQEDADVQPTATAVEPATAAEKEQESDKPTDEAAKEDAPTEATTKPLVDTNAAVTPTIEAKEPEKIEQDNAEPPAKAAETSDDKIAKVDIEEAAKTDDAEKKTDASSGETGEENQ